MEKKYSIEQMLELPDSELAEEMRSCISYFIEHRDECPDGIQGLVEGVTNAVICIAIIGKD